ncbi:T9SS type A sorting domain-containing protein [Dyadobacter psychrotolerans]|uniref:T9SS type A sorting domain-containing protein n=1 Tax=Dyadobacter psychrotolerans TaxID=2541721 RepID=A0A4R5DIF0_9BACT|nr:T9SS type A sorting domain-containing protein [Dyadobacter psychrotolerans]TDE13689.1 T9SS type A sorting domain-containing protein [Dyadobacter psychrotolerans]
MKVIFRTQSLLLLILTLILPATVFGQIYTNTFTGASACPTPGNVPVVATNATGSGLSRTSVTCNATLSTFNSSTLNNTAIITDSYIQFSVAANAGYQLNLTSLSFFRQGSNTAPNQLEVRYSTDGFATAGTSWGAAPTTAATGSVATWDFTDFLSPVGGTVTFRIYPYGTQRVSGSGTAQAGGTFRLNDVTVNGTVTGTLPVKLISFNGYPQDNSVVLKWSTVWEEENEGFAVERSNDAIRFSETAFLKGNINTKSQSDYEYRDGELQQGQTYYYRLKQLDLDGSFAYSRIISVKISDKANPESFIYPNPNRGSFTVQGGDMKPGSIRLYNSSGSEVPVVVNPANGNNSFLLKAKSDLLPGLYHIKVNTQNDKGRSKLFKVVVTD